MGENNENIQQPILENAEMGEQPVASADQNIVATQNEGLMENDPFQETPLQADTGAKVEEPQPIVEQQIALDVNIDEVFEGGPTKEDEITKIVSDAMGNTPVQPEQQVPVELAPAPAVEQSTIESSQQEPVITLEPGPITEIPAAEPQAPVAEEPAVEVPAQPVEIAIEAPVVPEAPIMPEIPILPEVPTIESSPQEPVITLEPGPITETTNPFDGIVPNIETTPVVEEIPQPADFQQAETAPVIDITPGPIETVQAVEQPTVESAPQEPVITLEPGPITENPVAEVSVPIATEPQVPVAEVPVENPAPAPVETPEFTIPEPTVETPVIETPVIEVPTPEAPVPAPAETPVLDPVADFAAISASPTEAPEPALAVTLEQVQNEIANQQIIAEGNNELTIPANSEQQSIVPVPVTAPIINEESVAETANVEETEKTIVLQSTPLGKVQPVAPIAVKEETTETKFEEDTEDNPTEQVSEEQVQPEEPVVEEATEEEPIIPVVEEQKEEKKKININDIDDLAIKMLEEEYKDVEITSDTKEDFNVEKSLYVDIEAKEETKKPRNSERKIITGAEKFGSNKRVEKQPENEPIIRFCSSCGNIVKKDDIVCSQCGDPVE